MYPTKDFKNYNFFKTSIELKLVENGFEAYCQFFLYCQGSRHNTHDASVPCYYNKTIT